MGEKLVFPDGCSGYGSPDDMPFGIANYQQKDFIGVNFDGVQLPLTLQRFTEQFIEQSQTIRNNKKDEKGKDTMNYNSYSQVYLGSSRQL